MYILEQLKIIEAIFDKGLDAQSTYNVLKIMGETNIPVALLEEMKLYSDYLPKVEDIHYTSEQRYLHFLWDTLDKLPISIIVNFAIPFRRMIASRLFKKCGKNFIAEENVRFNFGQNIEVGNDVFFNRDVYLDAKGGILIEDSVALAEGVYIFTHGHSESNHTLRSYGKVHIEKFAKIFVNATILPGCKIGEQAIVAANAIVQHEVAKNTLVGGMPAKFIRERHSEGKELDELEHIWLYKGAFQED